MNPIEIKLSEARGELRTLAATGERPVGCQCARKTTPVLRVVLAAKCPHHGRHTRIYRDAAEGMPSVSTEHEEDGLEKELSGGIVLDNWHSGRVGLPH